MLFRVSSQSSLSSFATKMYGSIKSFLKRCSSSGPHIDSSPSSDEDMSDHDGDSGGSPSGSDDHDYRAMTDDEYELTDDEGVQFSHDNKIYEFRYDDEHNRTWHGSDAAFDFFGLPADDDGSDIAMADAGMDEDLVSRGELDDLSVDDYWYGLTGKTDTKARQEVRDMTYDQKVECMQQVFEDPRFRSPRCLSGLHEPISSVSDLLHPVSSDATSAYIELPLPRDVGTTNYFQGQLVKLQLAEQVVRWFMEQTCPHFPDKRWREVVDMANPYLLHLWRIQYPAQISSDKRLVGKRAARPKAHYTAMKISGSAHILAKFGYGFQLVDADCNMKLRELGNRHRLAHYCFVCVLGEHVLKCHQQDTNFTMGLVLDSNVYEFSNSLGKKLRDHGVFSVEEMVARKNPSHPQWLGPPTMRWDYCKGVDFNYLRLFVLLCDTLGTVGVGDDWYENRFNTTNQQKTQQMGQPISPQLIAQTGIYQQETVVYLCQRGDHSRCNH